MASDQAAGRTDRRRRATVKATPFVLVPFCPKVRFSTVPICDRSLRTSAAMRLQCASLASRSWSARPVMRERQKARASSSIAVTIAWALIGDRS